MSYLCPKCERMLKNPNAVHCCVKKDFDELFVHKDPGLMLLFERLLAEIYDWEHVYISATQTCIVFFCKQTFLVIKPMKHQLNIKCYLDHEDSRYPVIKIGRYGKHYEHHVRISVLEEIDARLLSLIRSSYELLK